MATQENSGSGPSDAAQQTERAEEQTDRVDSYSPEYPDAANPPRASEPPKSD